LPGSIIVNRQGRRFVNEAMNYNDFAKAMMPFDPMRYEYANLPAFLIFDQRFRDSYAIGEITPDRPTPGWLVEADTLRELADEIGVARDGLARQVAEFNEHAVDGADPAFGRGGNAFDRYRGDPSVSPNPTLRPLVEGPFYALELHLGCLGTKGGPRIDHRSRVLDIHEQPIPGLFACGNAAASVFGPGYPGAGAPLGSGITFGYIAGRTLTDASTSV
jgi:3-oxosteroid 1-dehydrogenase